MGKQYAVVGALIAGFLLIGGGAFAGGQSTRLSEDEVAKRVEVAVTEQVEQDERAQNNAVKWRRSRQRKFGRTS